MDFGIPSPLVVVHDRLKAHYGMPLLGPHFPPLEMLIMAMLGSRTRDALSWKAYGNLRKAFASWQAVAEASEAQLRAHLRDVTYPQKYASYVPGVLRAILDGRGRLSLDFLADWPVDRALAWLQALHG
ncbi:MAG: hypothetical protein ACRECY_16100, partial [Phyllobacterium sp.]